MGQVQDESNEEEKSNKKQKTNKKNKNAKRDDVPQEAPEDAPHATGDDTNVGSDTEAVPSAAPEGPTEASDISEDVQTTSGPSNYTICSPQLLHVDVAGKPLWFNGWLLDNKYADKSKQKFAHFEEYLIEPHDIREPGAWQLGEANMCCLTSDPDKYFVLSEEDKAVLQMIMGRALEVKAGSQLLR